MGSSLGEGDRRLSWRCTSAAEVRARIAQAFEVLDAGRTLLGDITLLPHQREGVRLLSRTIEIYGGALLADDVGMGKTFTALAAAHDATSVVVVAPASLRAMWHDAARRAQRPITLVSYEQLSAGGRELPPAGFVIADEAHHARNPRTRRYDALARLTRHARVLLLTATPVHNREHDLRHLLALFLGARALDADDALLRACTIRRSPTETVESIRLPAVSPLRWLPLPHNEQLVDALTRIPAPVPPQDGGSADALLGILLLRLWCSSDAALRGALRRMLVRATALTAALQEGRYPRRDQLSAWSPDQDGLQLAFAALVVPDHGGQVPTHELLRRLDAHAEGLRHAIDCLADGPSADAARHKHLERIGCAAGGAGVIAFTQFEDTARGLFRRLRTRPGVALLSARGGETAIGRIPREDIVALAHPDRLLHPDPRFPLHLLLSTDLLSEGVNLGRLQHVVHIDLPWTPARAHQRLGRLRRPESPHGHIDVSAFELPAAAERIVGVLRTLQAKARASARLIGLGEMIAGAPWSGDGPTGSGGAAHLDADAELRVRLRPWRMPDAGVEAGAIQDADAPSVALVRSSAIHDWHALVLAYVEGIPRLVVVTQGEARDSAPAVMSSLALFEGEDCTDDLALAGVRDRMAAWLSTQRAASMARPVEHAAAGAHSRALRALAHWERALSRSERLRAAEHIARVRHLLTAQRGAGAERALAHVTPHLQLKFRLREALDAFIAHEADATAQEGVATLPEGEPCIVCVLVATPRDRG
jgi:hypothetical protein